MICRLNAAHRVPLHTLEAAAHSGASPQQLDEALADEQAALAVVLHELALDVRAQRAALNHDHPVVDGRGPLGKAGAEGAGKCLYDFMKILPTFSLSPLAKSSSADLRVE